jgi:multiple antibiotic resistance protein
MQNPQDILHTFVLLWAVIDPIGTIPVFIAATRNRSDAERREIALIATASATGILLFFIILGEILLQSVGVPLLVFKIAGGMVLFLFALTMIFGEGKPEGELKMMRSISDTAIFPLATPSIASPGSMMAVVLLTENHSYTIIHQAVTALVMLIIMLSVYLLMLGAGRISRVIGEGGAGIISRVMGLILASIAATNVLEGLKEYFQ